MSSIIKSGIRAITANQFINTFNHDVYSFWITGESVSVGALRIANNIKYVATTTGTTGVIEPVHISSSASDGGVNWLFVEIITDNSNFLNKLYLCLGKTTAWDNPLLGDEVPINPNDVDSEVSSVIDNIVSAKLIESNSVKMAIRRYNWDVSGSTVYDQYDPTKSLGDYTYPFYVYVNSNIYKCLNNNNDTPSISMPTGTSINQFTTPGDNYTWKYIATISPGDSIQFSDDNYLPVEFKRDNDSSSQYNTQQNAKVASLSTIIITNGGTGYTSASVTISPPNIVGGVQASGSVIIAGGLVIAIDLSNIGSGYTIPPTITITGNGTSASGTAVLSPLKGHGSNILHELYANYAILSVRLDGDESGYFPVVGENDFRELTVISDPYDTNDNVASALRYIGNSHPSWTGTGAGSLLEFKRHTGDVLYINTIPPLIRSTSQIENITFVFKF